MNDGAGLLGQRLKALWLQSKKRCGEIAANSEQPSTVVDVRIPDDQAWRLNQVFGSGTVDGGERIDEPDRPGTVRLRLRLGYPAEVPGLLLACGDHLEVVGPDDIRDRVVRLANRIAARYREAIPDAGR